MNEGRIKQKDVKIFASIKNFAEGMKKGLTWWVKNRCVRYC